MLIAQIFCFLIFYGVRINKNRFAAVSETGENKNVFDISRRTCFARVRRGECRQNMYSKKLKNYMERRNR